MNRSRSLLSLGLSLALFPALAHAHRQWILPSTTVLSGEGQWISVEAASSNNLFFPNHRPLRIESIVVLDPDGQPVQPQNAVNGEIRSSFELKLEKQGTYAISQTAGGGRRGPGGPGGGAPGGPGGQGGPGGGQGGATLMGTWEENGQVQRWRGTPESLVAEGVAAKPGFKLLERGSRQLVTYVTCGAPTTKVFAATGKGFEIDFVTHPNDLFHGETATFRLLVDGKPAARGEVAIVAGDDRFRNDAGEIIIKSDKDGNVKIDWPAPGRYWLEASASAPGTLHGVPSEKTSTFITVLEVLPQ